jgi:hypothetical protein
MDCLVIGPLWRMFSNTSVADRFRAPTGPRSRPRPDANVCYIIRTAPKKDCATEADFVTHGAEAAIDRRQRPDRRAE